MSEISNLAYFIKDELFSQWKQQRANLELKWQRNLDAFNSVSNGQWKSEEAEGWRSDTFISVTKQKVMIAYSMILDVLLPGGEFPFALQPSAHWGPLEQLTAQDKNRLDQMIDEHSNLIKQQLQKCKADRQLMRCVLAAALYGQSAAKKYVYLDQESRYQLDAYGQAVKTVSSKAQPAWEYIPNWEFYWDMESSDLQEGVGVIQRQHKSAYWLRSQMGKPYYLRDGIERAIKEADRQDPQVDTNALPPRQREIQHRRAGIEYLEFWGRVPRRIVEQWERDQGQILTDPDYEHDGDEVEIMACVAGDEVVRYARTEPGERPFYLVIWEERLDDAYGIGVADNMEDTQMVLNGAVRGFEDNMRLSANVILAIKEELFNQPPKEIKPGMKIDLAPECQDARQAIQSIQIPNVGAQLLDLIGLMERYGDEASQIPKILQGAVHAKQKPDTATELNQLQENAGKYLGAVVRNFDEGLIEPVVQDFYEYNMDDPDCPAQKADLDVVAMGFTSFQNRVRRIENLMKVLQLALSHETLFEELRTREIIEEIAKGLDLDPREILLTPEEKEQQQAARMQMEQKAQYLEMALKEAQIAKAQADAALAQTKMGSEQADQLATMAGVELDRQKLMIERAKAVKDIETKDITARKDQKEQGPYREKGMKSNNESKKTAG